MQGQTADTNLVPSLEVRLALLGQRLGRQPTHVFMFHLRARHEAVPRQTEDVCIELLLQLGAAFEPILLDPVEQRRLHHQQNQAGQGQVGSYFGDFRPNHNTDYRQDDRYQHQQTLGHLGCTVVAVAGPQKAPIYIRRLPRRDIISKAAH